MGGGGVHSHRFGPVSGRAIHERDSVAKVRWRYPFLRGLRRYCFSHRKEIFTIKTNRQKQKRARVHLILPPSAMARNASASEATTQNSREPTLILHNSSSKSSNCANGMERKIRLLALFYVNLRAFGNKIYYVMPIFAYGCTVGFITQCFLSFVSFQVPIY